MDPVTELVALVPLIALAIPATFALVGVASPRHAGHAGAAALAMALLVTAATVLTRGTKTPEPTLGVVIDAATCVMLLLVCALGAIIIRYSRTYLRGDAGLATYLRWLTLTLSAVTAVVVANNLAVVALGWTATSLALHRLLTFYSERPAALIAAHKKFLVSRLADASFVMSLALVHTTVGTFEIDGIIAWVNARPGLPFSMEVAAVLLVIAVALRSAQLPFHGWLTQVMEAPTPVSALLHAGVVNIGGFVLIRLAPWITQAEPARLLLVTIGLSSACIGALIMTTRISVKVALAWSTCAQMGFMLVQCGLGLWPLALLHLVAHSLYKAHAFLSAGSVVDDWKLRAQSQRRPQPSALGLGLAVVMATSCGALGVIALRTVTTRSASDATADLVLALLVSLSVIPLVSRRPAASAPASVVGVRLMGVVLLYVGWHAVAGWVMPYPDRAPSLVCWIVAAAGLVGLFVVKVVLQVRPTGRFAQRIHPWLFSGLYLDERFTRLTFRIWPPRLRPRSASLRAIHVPQVLEVRA